MSGTMAVMLPGDRWTDKLRNVVAVLTAARAALAWGAVLWTIVVAVPFVLLYPAGGLDRPVVIALGALPPFAMFVAALTRQPQLLLGIGLSSMIPVLVAAPSLLSPVTAGALQGVTVGVLVLLYVTVCLDLVATPRGQLVAVAERGRLRRLFHWPKRWRARGVMLLGIAWLILAWLPADAARSSPGSLRAARIAAVALCWMAVNGVRVGPRRQLGVSTTQPMSLLLRRAVWLGLLLGAWLWFRAVPEGKL